MKIIGVTGTNGKTTCVHMITNLLKDSLNCASFGTLGIKHFIDNQCFETSTSLTTLGNQDLHKHLKQVIDSGCQLLAMEVSSHGLVQNRIANINFTDLIFTNLSHDHLDYHQNMDNYFQAKSRLFLEYGKYATRAIINLDCDYGLKLVTLLQQNLSDLQNFQLEIIGYSTKKLTELNASLNNFNNLGNKNASLNSFGNKLDINQFNIIKKITCESIKFNFHGLEAFIHTPWGESKLSLNLLGIHNLSNLLASIAVCIDKLPLETILKKSSTLQPPKGRLQTLKLDSTIAASSMDNLDNAITASSMDNLDNAITASNMDNLNNVNGVGLYQMTSSVLPKIIIDYAHTPDGLKNALLALHNHYPNYKICCVFGCGGNRDIGKRPKMLAVAESYCNTIILTQDNSRQEDPRKIINAILSHKTNKAINVYIELDRKAAIYKAINDFCKDHIILIAGKGHENIQIIGDKEYFFCDYQVAQESLKQLGILDNVTMDF